MKLKVFKLLVAIYSYIRYRQFDNDYFKALTLKYRKYRTIHYGKPLKFTKPKNNTVFVIASGESLSELTDDEWSVIEKHDSIGVNMSICNDYPVDVQIWEPIESNELNKLFLSRIMSSKFSRTKLVYSSLYAERNNLLSQLDENELNYLQSSYCYYPYELTMDKPDEKTLIKLYDHFYDEKSLFHHCTQIGAVVDYCYKSGYKNVILVGCDLNGGKYFTEINSKSRKYSNNESYDLYNRYRKLKAKEIGIYYGNRHPSMLKEHTHIRGRLTALEYFKFIVKKYDMKDFKLMVSSSKSSLSEFLPIYEFKDGI